jgi:hypothetical protein
MNDAPRRKRFQVHLSTAVVLMFAAGLLMSVNMMERVELKLFSNGTTGVVNGLYRTTGWPFAAREKLIELIGLPPNVMVCGNIFFEKWSSTAIELNAMVALAILFALWFVCEWWVRRRERGRERTAIGYC